MVQQNGNKQHFTIIYATPSNPANRILESIYYTFNFVFSIRPEVNLVGSIVCEHPRATKLTQRLMEWCESIIAETNIVPPAVTDDCSAGYDTCLNDGEQSQRSNQQQVQDRCPRFLLDTNKNPHCHPQLAAITLLPAEASIIYFHNNATPPTTIKKTVKNKSK